MVEFEKPGECPSGTDCPTHFRVDREVRIDDEFFYSNVTYVNEWCVLTGDNPDHMGNPVPAIMHMISTGRLPDDCFSTQVYRVGRQGTLYDIVTSGVPLTPERSFSSRSLDAAQASHAIAVSWVASL